MRHQLVPDIEAIFLELPDFLFAQIRSRRAEDGCFVRRRREVWPSLRRVGREPSIARRADIRHQPSSGDASHETGEILFLLLRKAPVHGVAFLTLTAQYL